VVDLFNKLLIGYLVRTLELAEGKNGPAVFTDFFAAPVLPF
jgi:hypothetical protein